MALPVTMNDWSGLKAIANRTLYSFHSCARGAITASITPSLARSLVHPEVWQGFAGAFARYGIFDGMNTTIDSAGRLVIPIEIRRQAGIKEGMALDIRVAEGRIEIEPTPLKVAIKRRGRLLVAVPDEAIPEMTSEVVEDTRRKVRRRWGR